MAISDYQFLDPFVVNKILFTNSWQKIFVIYSVCQKPIYVVREKEGNYIGLKIFSWDNFWIVNFSPITKFLWINIFPGKALCNSYPVTWDLNGKNPIECCYQVNKRLPTKKLYKKTNPTFKRFYPSSSPMHDGSTLVASLKKPVIVRIWGLPIFWNSTQPTDIREASTVIIHGYIVFGDNIKIFLRQIFKFVLVFIILLVAVKMTTRCSKYSLFTWILCFFDQKVFEPFNSNNRIFEEGDYIAFQQLYLYSR